LQSLKFPPRNVWNTNVQYLSPGTYGNICVYSNFGIFPFSSLSKAQKNILKAFWKLRLTFKFYHIDNDEGWL